MYHILTYIADELSDLRDTYSMGKWQDGRSVAERNWMRSLAELRNHELVSRNLLKLIYQIVFSKILNGDNIYTWLFFKETVETVLLLFQKCVLIFLSKCDHFLSRFTSTCLFLSASYLYSMYSSSIFVLVLLVNYKLLVATKCYGYIQQRRNVRS